MDLDFGFLIETGAQKFPFYCTSEETEKRWIETVSSCLDKLTLINQTDSILLKVRPRELKIRLICGRNLKVGDRSGTSDPYVRFFVGGQTVTSDVIYKTLNPHWSNQEWILRVDNPDTDTLDIQVYDKDSFGKDDFLGSHMLPVSFMRKRFTDGEEDVAYYRLERVNTGEVRLGLTVYGFGGKHLEDSTGSIG